MDRKPDFSGWATKADVTCSDGRVIMHDAFKDCDGEIVPLVWNHQHNDPNNILGHALLKNMGDGVYAYGYFNESESANVAKILLQHGDITSMSILANKLKEDGKKVMHGIIREVSLVVAGANPKAFIENVLTHSGDIVEDTVRIHFDEALSIGEDIDTSILEHADTDPEPSNEEPEDDGAKKDTNKEPTYGEVFMSMSDDQKNLLYAMLEETIKAKNENDEGGNDSMKQNLFDQDKDLKKTEGVLSHEAQMTIIGDAKRFGSMKESVVQHAETYGINQIDYLLPGAETVTRTPEFIKRDTTWVSDVMNGVHRSPFSRIKSIFADITADEARAKGYMKGKLKKEEVFGLLKRSTTPTTVYKKQKMDRDDVIDITDFDVITWLKTEMRWMLDEELARAILVGDGRLTSDDDKINEQNIRPIWKDEELFTIKARFDATSGTDNEKVKAFIRAAVKARKDYQGSGNPVLFTTEDVLTDALLLTDEMGRDLYESVDKLATKLRVSRIVTVPVMEGLTRNGDGDDSGSKYSLYGIIVNMNDYYVGADKGGAVNMFEDFDIDYNQQKYLIETRCSGALVKPYSAIVLEGKISG